MENVNYYPVWKAVLILIILGFILGIILDAARIIPLELTMLVIILIYLMATSSRINQLEGRIKDLEHRKEL